MAESFHNIIDRGDFIVKQFGEEVRLEIPGFLQALKGKTDSLEGFEEWIGGLSDDERLGFYQCAVQKKVIDCRGKAKTKVMVYKTKAEYEVAVSALSNPTDYILDDKNFEISLKISCDQEAAQARLHAFKWVSVPRPGISKAAEKAKTEIDTLAATIVALMQSGQTSEQIRQLFKTQFDRVILAKAMDQAEASLED